MDLLTELPWLRNFLRTDFWPRGINDTVTPPLFAAVVLLLVFGPQHRDGSAALNVFWCWCVAVLAARPCPLVLRPRS